jgi:hypothetical protein
LMMISQYRRRQICQSILLWWLFNLLPCLLLHSVPISKVKEFRSEMMHTKLYVKNEKKQYCQYFLQIWIILDISTNQQVNSTRIIRTNKRTINGTDIVHVIWWYSLTMILYRRTVMLFRIDSTKSINSWNRISPQINKSWMFRFSIGGWAIDHQYVFLRRLSHLI